MFSEKATKSEKNIPYFLTSVVVAVQASKNMGDCFRILWRFQKPSTTLYILRSPQYLQIFVAFLENLNFMYQSNVSMVVLGPRGPRPNSILEGIKRLEVANHSMLK